jgi:hypothetical protein
MPRQPCRECSSLLLLIELLKLNLLCCQRCCCSPAARYHAAAAYALLPGQQPQHIGKQIYGQLGRLPLRLHTLSCCQVDQMCLLLLLLNTAAQPRCVTTVLATAAQASMKHVICLGNSRVSGCCLAYRVHISASAVLVPLLRQHLTACIDTVRSVDCCCRGTVCI